MQYCTAKEITLRLREICPPKYVKIFEPDTYLKKSLVLLNYSKKTP